MKQQCDDTDDRFDSRVGQDRYTQASRVDTGQPRAYRHATHEDDQHQRLGVGRVPEKELEIMGPDRLVDQPRKAGDHEDPEEQRGRRAKPRRHVCGSHGAHGCVAL